jgi:hypothetical protein
MTNDELTSVFLSLIGLLNDNHYSDFVRTKLLKYNAELMEALDKAMNGQPVWPAVDWEAVSAELRARNPSDPSIPLPKNIADHEGHGDE